MENKELLEILNERFNKIDEKFEKIDQRFNKIDEKFEKIDQRFDKVEKRMNTGFKEINDKINTGFKEINNKLDILTNSNMAQILSVQTQTTKEINRKIDKYIEKNEVEHKKFDYEISETKMNIKFAR